MSNSTPFIAALFIAALIATPSVVVAQHSDPSLARMQAEVDAFKLFNDCRPLAVQGSRESGVSVRFSVSSDLSEALEITERSVEAAVVRRLEERGLTTADERLGPLGDDLLHGLMVDLQIVSFAGWQLVLDLSYLKTLGDEYGNTWGINTWESGSSEQLEELEERDIMTALLVEVDAFASEYLRVNALACGP